MKKTITKIVGAVMFTATFTLAITSCQKGEVAPVSADVIETDASKAGLKWIDTIPSILKVSAEDKLSMQAYAKGFQIYQVQRSVTDPNIYLWVNIAPLATLYSDEDYTKQVGIHYAGPTWEFTKGPNKGEKVVAKRLESVTEDPTAIPWLLLQAVDSLSSANNKITYIQRLATAGGLAPTIVADEAHLGQLDSIPYTARYFFYKAKIDNK